MLDNTCVGVFLRVGKSEISVVPGEVEEFRCFYGKLIFVHFDS